APRSLVLLASAARRRPLPDAGQIIIGAVAVRPHGQNERPVGRAFILETGDQHLQPFKCRVSCSIDTAILEIDVAFFAGRVAAIELDIAEFGNGAAGSNAREGPVAQHCGLQSQLRSNADLHLRARWRRAGLKVENGVAAIDQTLDTVGAAGQTKYAGSGRNRQLAANFNMRSDDLAAAFRLEVRKPPRDTFVTRPPDGARLRKILQRREMPLAKTQEFPNRIIR